MRARAQALQHPVAQRPEVWLSRLARFMETVEKITGAIAEPLVEDRDEARVAEPDVEIKPRPAPQAAPDGWATLVQK